MQRTFATHGIYITLSAIKQVVVVVVDTLCHIQYRICGATHMQLYATSLQLISMPNSHTHSNVANKMPSDISSICRQMTYVNTFCNLFTIILQLV